MTDLVTFVTTHDEDELVSYMQAQAQTAAIDAAIERETEMIERGHRRAHAQIQKALDDGRVSETPAGQRIVSQGIEPLVEAIRVKLTDATKGKPGRKNRAVTLLDGVSPELCAYVAIRMALEAASQGKSLKSAALLVARAIENELIADAFEEKNEALYKTVVQNGKNRSLTPSRIANAVLHANRHFEVVPEIWDSVERISIGTALLELVIETLGICKIEHVASHWGSSHSVTVTLAFTSEIGEWLKDYNENAAFAKPMWLAQPVKPKPWTGISGGGYYTMGARQTRLITRAFPGQNEANREANLDPLYKGLNAIQETPWRVNTRVLDVMQTLWEQGSNIGGLPPREDEILPEPPQEVKDDVKGGRIRKAWRQKVRLIHMANAKARSKRFTFAQLLQLARDNLKYDAFYFPHHIDFRSRAYAMTTGLSPQGPDEARGLLEFAEGKPLGERGLFWLGVHGANLWGNDKVELDDRAKWASEHVHDATRVAMDPLSNLWWTEADKPWCFLAWCFEWAQAHEIGEFENFVSHLPVALDGSCNGIQHYSAMLRDPVGGKAVNLIPSDTPQDIYRAVSDRVNEQLRAIPEDAPDRWLADAWLAFGVDRSTTKRPVMVLPYGGTFRSCSTYTSDQVNEKLSDGAENPFGDSLPEAKSFLAKHVWAAIQDTVIGAKEAMKWLQKVASVATKAGVPIKWTTPTGFVVVQAYRDVSDTRIETRFLGSVIKFRGVPSASEKLSGHKQRNTIAPNFVHSLDASALYLTVGRCVDKGVTAFAMIHDSYGTHAADTDVLAATLRDAFVDMYQSHDVLKNFRDEVAAQLPDEFKDKLPPLPEKGNLDLNAVKDSLYFFA